MLGRFLAALLLVMLVALAGTALEKHNREQLRQISLQTYRWQVLQRDCARARLMAETEGAPARMLERLGQSPAQLPPTGARAAVDDTLADQGAASATDLAAERRGVGGLPEGEVPPAELLSTEGFEPGVAGPVEPPDPDRVAGRDRVEPGD